MANIWSRLFGKVEEERDQNDWAQMFNFNGVAYGSSSFGNYSPNSKSESMSDDFLGHTSGAYKSSGAVFACCMARMLIFTEARFQYQKMRNGRPGELFGTKDLEILENPWPNGTTGELLARALQDTDLSGNHFIVNESDRLRRFRPDWVDIMLSGNPSEDVDVNVLGHIYKPGGTPNPELWKIYPIDGSMGKVAHWSPIPDPEAQYRGMSWMTPLYREILGDKSMQTHKQRFFDNGASPQTAVAMKETVTQKQFEDFVRTSEQGHMGLDNAYKTMYLGGGADVTVLGRDLKQMDFAITQNVGEARIAAAARVPTAIAGVGEGASSTVFRNEGGFDAVREFFGSATMRPLWRSVSTAYAPLVKKQDNARLWFDDRDVAFLRRDQLDAAMLRGKDSDTVSAYIMNGFTPESAVAAVNQDDITLLKHTGYLSVQLQPALADPNSTTPNPNGPANTPAPADGKQPPKPAQTPTGNGKQPPPTTKGQAK